MKLTQNDIRTVVEDVEYLQKHWEDGANEAELRRGSAILRRLLVEGIIDHARRAQGFKKELRIIAPNIDYAYAGLDKSKVICALAGGAKSNGVIVAGMCAQGGAHTLKMDEKFIEFDFGLSAYLSSTCAIVDGKNVSRGDLIKYMANTKGGVHLGSSHARKREEVVIKTIEKIEGRVKVINHDGLYFELLSIGQAVANSPDSTTFIENFRNSV